MRVKELITSGLLGAVFATLVMATASQAQTATDTKLAPAVPVGLGPEGVATDGSSVFVANQFSDTVTKLQASDSSVIGTYPVGHRLVALAFAGTFF